MQDTFNVTAMTLIDNPEGTTVATLVSDILVSSNEQHVSSYAHDDITTSMWIAPSPISVKMRLFCFPYAGGISENVFARQASLICNDSRSGIPVCSNIFTNIMSRGEMFKYICRWAMMMPPSIQVCPVELPGRGRREEEMSISNVVELAQILAHALPLEVCDFVTLENGGHSPFSPV